MTLQDVLLTSTAILASLGGGAVIVLSAANWLGKVWATRIAAAERARFEASLEGDRARFSRELENYRTELGDLSAFRKDALSRKRDVYAALAASMRIFVGRTRHATHEQHLEFYRAYDLSCLWASEEVAAAVGTFLDAMKASVGGNSVVSEEETTRLYSECIVAMRRDCGFPDTNLDYRLVSF